MEINTLTTSIVIPVYNEADSLYACLEAIAKLKTKPYEVIVVDNNSTDGSAEVAARFNWVTLVSEEKQGVVHARSRGFDEANGDIIARIDADTLLKPDWINKIEAIFDADTNLAAVSGSSDYYDFHFKKLANSIDRMARRYLEKRLKRHLFLFGSNMAIRQTAWKDVRGDLCAISGIHEDLDLAIHLQEAGLKVAYNSQLVAGVSSRRVSSGFSNFIRYSLVSPRTYSSHGLKSHLHMYPVIFFLWMLYGPAHLIYLSYNPQNQAFSLRYLLQSRMKDARIDPTINVA